MSLLDRPIPPKIKEGQVTFKREQIGKNDYPKQKLTKEQREQAREWFDGKVKALRKNEDAFWK